MWKGYAADDPYPKYGALTRSSVEANKITSICVGKHEGHDLIVRKGKYGLYMTWGKSKKSLAYLGNRPLENIKITDIHNL